MAPHTWSQHGDMVSDSTHHMYYHGQRIKEAYYRGQCIWKEDELPPVPSVTWHDTFFLDFTNTLDSEAIASGEAVVYFDLCHYSRLIISWGDGTWEYAPDDAHYVNDSTLTNSHIEHVYKISTTKTFRISVHATTYNQWIWRNLTNAFPTCFVYRKKNATSRPNDIFTYGSGMTYSSWRSTYIDINCLIGAFFNTHMYSMDRQFYGSTSIRGFVPYSRINTGGLTYNEYARQNHYILYADSTPYIGAYAFDNCTNLREIVIGSGIRQLHVCTFYRSTKPSYTVKFACYSTKLQYVDGYCFTNSNIYGTLNLGNSIKYVARYAFYNCALDITTFSFGNSSELYIGEYAFYNAFYSPQEGTSAYTKQMAYSFRIPSNIVMLNPYSFYGLPKVGTVQIGPGLKAPLSMSMIFELGSRKITLTITGADYFSAINSVFDRPLESCNINVDCIATNVGESGVDAFNADTDFPDIRYNYISDILYPMNFKTNAGYSIYSDDVSRDEDGHRYVPSEARYDGLDSMFGGCNADELIIDGSNGKYPNYMNLGSNIMNGFRGRKLTIRGMLNVSGVSGLYDLRNVEELYIDTKYFSPGSGDGFAEYGIYSMGKIKNGATITFSDSLKGIYGYGGSRWDRPTSVQHDDDLSSTNYGKESWLAAHIMSIYGYTPSIPQIGSMKYVTENWTMPNAPDDIGITCILESSPPKIFAGHRTGFGAYRDLYMYDTIVRNNISDETVRAAFARYVDEWSDFVYVLFLSYPQDQLYIVKWDEYLSDPLWSEVIRKHPGRIHPYLPDNNNS